MKISDKEFKTIFFIGNYHFYVTIPMRNKSSFMFRVIECGKDCKAIEIYLKDYLRFKKKYKPHEFQIREKLTVFLTCVKVSNIIYWETLVRRKSLAYNNKWKLIYLKKYLRMKYDME